MTTTKQSGQKRVAAGALAVLALALIGLSGCSGTPVVGGQHQHDPLVGNRTPPTIPQPTDAPKTAGTTTSLPRTGNQQFAPIGSDLTSTNNATLASASGSTLGRPLALDDQGRAMAPNGPAPTQNPYPPYNPKPRVEKIPDAEPAQAKYTPSSWQSDRPAATNAIPATPTEALTRQLQERGVINQKIDQLSEGIHLTCYVSRGAGGLRVLEVTAVDYTTAVQAILHQLDAGRTVN